MSEDSHLKEQRQHSEQVYRGHFLNIMRDTVRLPDGGQAVREYVVHPGAVMVIPLLGEGDALRVVLERQHRYPVDAVMTEFPAGKLDPGEAVKACAQRELHEETGYTAGAWARAGRMHLAIAYSTESIDVWFARDLRPGARQLDAGEFLDVITATPQELLDWCAQGRVTDAKTLAGALWMQNVLSGRWSLEWEPAAA